MNNNADDGQIFKTSTEFEELKLQLNVKVVDIKPSFYSLYALTEENTVYEIGDQGATFYISDNVKDMFVGGYSFVLQKCESYWPL